MSEAANGPVDGNGKGKPEFTPTEGRIIALLSDGLNHRRAEILACIDEFADGNTMRVHIFNIRTKLKKRGRDVVCTYDRKRAVCYRMVITVVPEHISG